MTFTSALLIVHMALAAPGQVQVAAPASAQAQTAASGSTPAPVRDNTPPPTSGTASVSGVVVNDEVPAQPVRRAIVTLKGDGLRPSRGAVTDDAGRFVLAGLPAGQFTVTVSRASFITSMYGAKRPGRPGTPITVAEGATVADLSVRIWRGAAVAGTLRDDMGAPIGGIEVAAIPARAPGSLLTLSNNSTTTNELGEFRIFGLEPGTYIVAARPGSTGSSPMLALSDAETDAAIEAIKRRTTNQPAARASSAAATEPPDPRPFDYAPIYFPGTSSITQAKQLVLTAGRAETSLDFSLQRVRTSLVSGLVTRPDGSPAGGASLQLSAIVPPGAFRGSSKLELSATAAPDGTFRIAQITPGDYELVARAPVDVKAPGTRPGYIEPPSTPQLFTVTNIAVSGNDIQGLGLLLAPGVPMSGNVVFESDTQKPPASLTGIRFALLPDSKLPADPNRFPADALRLPPAASVKADGTFEFAGIAPGRYQLQVFATGVDTKIWQLKSAVTNGRDVLDGLLDIAPGASASLVVTYDDKPTALTGRLETETGAPASDVFVIAFAAERGAWGPYSRRLQAVRPSVDGAYAIRGLPAGDYRLAAITDADPDDWQNPAFLEQLFAVSIPLRLTGGQPVLQNIRMAR